MPGEGGLVNTWIVEQRTGFRLIAVGAVLVMLALLSAPVAGAITGASGVIAFQSDRYLFDQIYTMNADGSNVKPLPELDAELVTPATLHPTCSTDASTVAVAT